jgi:hypothetical protein
MASKQFSAALSKLKETKNLDAVLVGTDYLSVGTYEVYIKAVDVADVDDNKLKITYATDDGKEYTSRIFITSTDGEQLSYDVRRLLSGTIPNKELFGKLLEMADQDNNNWTILTGMRTKITLQPGKGYQVRANEGGKFVVYELDRKGETVGPLLDEEFDDIGTARDTAKAAGFKPSYLNISRSEATHAESNGAAFNVACESLSKPARAVGSVNQARTAAGIRISKV